MIRARDLRPGDRVGSREVARVVPGHSAGPIERPAVLIYYTDGTHQSAAAEYLPRNTSPKENNR